ncbi:hypothetical protein GCM10027430_16930 [Lysobacter tyrosinilyticus]
MFPDSLGPGVFPLLRRVGTCCPRAWPKLPLPFEKITLAKPNYSFEKRQRELAKKKQQDEKQAKKQKARDATKADADADAEPAPPTTRR